MRRRLPILLLLIATILLPVASSRQVLCLGTDGHIQVEDIGSPCCTAGIDATADQARTPAVAPDELERRLASTSHDCGRCTDFPLLSSGDAAQSCEAFAMGAISTEASLFRAVVIVPAVACVASDGRARSTLTSAPLQAPRGTIVLLI